MSGSGFRRLLPPALVALLMAGSATNAFAAGALFSGLEEKLWEIGDGLVILGAAATFVGAAWTILAWMGRLGGMATAVGILIGGIFLSQLRTFVEYLF